MPHFRLLLGLSLLLAACSTGPSTSEPPAPFTSPAATPELELLMSRAAIGMVEFEQYKLSAGQLYHECGQIKRGRYLALEQDVSRLTSEQLQMIAGRTVELTQSLTQQPHKFQGAGINSGIGDPGVFELTLAAAGNRQTVKTSVDNIAAHQGRLERKTKLLTESLRGTIDRQICGNFTFYGIGQAKR